MPQWLVVCCAKEDVMLERLEEVERRFEEVATQLADPAVLADHNEYTRLAREHGELNPIVTAVQRYREAEAELAEAREMLRDDDGDVREMAKEEMASLTEEIEQLQQSIRLLLIPKDPLDEKNIILEIRAGTGGDEAALFAGNLLAMYERFAANHKFKVEIVSVSPGSQGGFKEVVAEVSGDSVYSHLKYEAGTHRVQRVPATESQGRIHTSACTVAVLPEADEVDVDVNENDLQIDTYRASGAGGQHVNTTDSAVRITHLPTGVVVTSQDERSQHKNKARAMKVLRSRILEAERARAHAERASARKGMVGSGDRSERIRTYNYPQNRITDHRIGLTIHSLDRTMATGELGEIIDALRAEEQTQNLGD